MVIDFYATWCGPCLLMAKELEKVAAEMGGAVRIVKLDVDANPDIASQVRRDGKERGGGG
jgi:thioredoxin-like negative regulator of GroEL